VLAVDAGENGVAHFGVHEAFIGLHGARLAGEAHLHFAFELACHHAARVAADLV
jgi:hypothetical protein